MMMAALRANEIANRRREVSETERSNRVKERETERSNLAKERETHRSNLVNEMRQEATDKSVRALNYERTNTERTQQASNSAAARKYKAEASVTEETGVDAANAKIYKDYAKGSRSYEQAQGQRIDNEWKPKMYKSERLRNTGSFIKNVTGAAKDVSAEARGWVTQMGGTKSSQMAFKFDK